MDGVNLKKTNIKALVYNAKEPVKFQGKFEATIETKTRSRGNIRDLTMRQRQRRRQPQSILKGLERGVAVAVHVVVNFPYDWGTFTKIYAGNLL